MTKKNKIISNDSKEELKIAEADENISEWDIDTGEIFRSISSKWLKYDREFLKDVFENALINTLGMKKIFSIKYDESTRHELQGYFEFLNRASLEIKNNHFPFPNYFMRYSGPMDPLPSLICYDEPCVIKITSFYFDLFYSLKLSITDIMKVDDFFEYHLENSFYYIFDDYKVFLENIIIKYNDFLHGKHEAVVKRFISRRLSPPVAISEADSKVDSNKENTLRRQVLAIHYLLREIGESEGIDKTEIARFVQFLTGRELNAAHIRNTNIYKKVTILLTKSEKTIESDLQFVREQFEKIGISSIARKLTTEIGSKE